MQQAVITFLVRATGPDLHLSVMLDGEEIQALEPGGEDQKLSIEINDDVEQDHVLCLVMSGKQMDHTLVDDQGQILEDRMIEITDVRIDDIELGYVFTQTSKYIHDHNGTSDLVTVPFYGAMGCNGQVDFHFTTPVYLWLLENM
jgi:hypothetical protein